MRSSQERRIRHTANLKTRRTVETITKSGTGRGQNREGIVRSRKGTYRKLNVGGSAFYIKLETTKR